MEVGDGHNTDFWNDCWADVEPLATKFPALHSHYAARARSVHDVVRSELRDMFQPRLSTQAAAELGALTQLLQDVALNNDQDRRTCFFEDSSQRLVAGLIYQASVRGDHDCASYAFVWKTFAPPRVKFFAWLLTKERIHCRTNLQHKSIVDDATCEVCKGAPETVDHIFSGCPFVHSFWASIGWAPQHIAPCKNIWLSSPPGHVATRILHPALLLICWEIWKHRNDVVFNALPPSIPRLTAAIKGAAKDWRCRIPRQERATLQAWSLMFPM